ncbi:hypothetical protein TraAM80_00111 [Trypanosoma rangeli]|uniref:Autophagy protein ATG5 UblA domain-containing protein n=1 Tax=Trypanosoma rangeli TaxID=5698 RepID=A0A422P4W0_TRYRA|nr:uncharacterized protein TraAM80_00111 [Trypanosoma rangeli]RNF12756.1 hypothetical protein TraAM80_00111 [Trypanosoma rangeli]|eukprot:RNF12756.1 hypothetical protein TraAM80_00111 [Trypanosoma rangeli]
MSLQVEEYMGGVPLIIYLSDADCTVQAKPAPLTYVLPRSSVLMAVRSEVQAFFSFYTVAREDTTPLVWLTWRGEPVPWHYPIGAIKDSISALLIAETDVAESRASQTEFSQLSPAELYAAVFGSPLILEARITCVSAERPLTVPVPGQEDVLSRRSADEAIGEFLKQVIKGTFSAMYGSIKALMDARSEVINELLSFATCTSIGDPFVQALRAYNDRIVKLRQLAGTPKNVAVMINIPLGKSTMQFVLFRVPLMSSGVGDDRPTQKEHEEPRSTIEGNDRSCNTNHDPGSVSDAVGVDAKLKGSPLDTPFGMVIWLALLGPYLKWQKLSGDDGSTSPGAEPFLRAISPFYSGLGSDFFVDEALSSPLVNSLVNEFIAAGDATLETQRIRVTLPASPPQQRHLCLIVQGLQPPLCTPVGYLLDRFASADGRLYVTLAAL